ncbi:MAG: VWA domain-containing protein [Planctomycetaceae bacterium]
MLRFETGEPRPRQASLRLNGMAGVCEDVFCQSVGFRWSAGPACHRVDPFISSPISPGNRGIAFVGAELRKESPGRTRERLPWTRTLLLELLAALLITLLLAEPRAGGFDTRPHLVLVLDNSASMAARGEHGGESSRDRALKWLKEQEPRLGRTGLFSVLTTGRRPTLIAGPRADWTEMLETLERWQPLETHHAFAPTWDLAAQLAGDEGELVFLTDQLPPEQTPMPRQMESARWDNNRITWP